MTKQTPPAPTASAVRPCPTMIGWLVVLGSMALSDSISVYIGPLPERGRKKREMTDKRKNDYFSLYRAFSRDREGWSGGAMVLGKLPVPGRPTILITVGQGPIALAVGAGGDGLDIFTLIYPFSSFSLSLGDGPI